MPNTSVKEFFAEALSKLDRQGYNWDSIEREFPGVRDESMLLAVTGDGGGRWGLFLQPQAEGSKKLMMVESLAQFSPTIYMEVDAWAIREMLVKGFSPYGLIMGYPESCHLRYNKGSSLWHLEQMSQIYQRVIEAIMKPV